MAKAKIEIYPRKNCTIQIDNSLCISCGSCAAIAPKTFELDDDLVCKVKPDPIDSLSVVEEAMTGCVVEAIKIIKDKASR